jgi:hypothetical protein
MLWLHKHFRHPTGQALIYRKMLFGQLDNFYELRTVEWVRSVSSMASVLLTKTELCNLASSTPTSVMVLSTLTLRHSTLRNDSSNSVIRKAADTITSTDRCGPRFWKAKELLTVKQFRILCHKYLMSLTIKTTTTGLYFSLFTLNIPVHTK